MLSEARARSCLQGCEPLSTPVLGLNNLRRAAARSLLHIPTSGRPQALWGVRVTDVSYISGGSRALWIQRGAPGQPAMKAKHWGKFTRGSRWHGDG